MCSSEASVVSPLIQHLHVRLSGRGGRREKRKERTRATARQQVDKSRVLGRGGMRLMQCRVLLGVLAVLCAALVRVQGTCHRMLVRFSSFKTPAGRSLGRTLAAGEREKDKEKEIE